MKSVLVTGANSGIGLYVAKRLAANGFYVYAGIRNPDRFAVVHGTDNIEAIKLDITCQDDIDAAVAYIKEQGRGLYGIVNNAGIQRFGNMNDIAEGLIQELFNTNVFGPQRINKAFSSMLIDSGGRTFAIGSISAFRPCVGSGAYGMSKAALSSYIDSYSREIKEFGIHAGIIEPGGYNTNILLNASYDDSLPEETKYRMQKKEKFYQMVGKPPHDVADVVLEAMTSDNPKRRYMVVPREDQATNTIKSLLEKVVELNSSHEFEISDDELIKMLEQLLVESSSE